MPSVPKLNLIRSERHRRRVAQHCCVICMGGRLVDAGYTVTQAAHLREGQTGGTSLKPCDSLTVPLCAEDKQGHHAEYDKSPVKFRLKYGLDLDKYAYVLAMNSVDPEIRAKVREAA